MKKEQWNELADAIKACRNRSGTLHYNYDNALGNVIDRYSPKNNRPNHKTDYRAETPEDSAAAIEAWVKEQQRTEDTCIITNAQLLLGEDESDAKQKAAEIMEKEKRLLVRPVANLEWNKGFPDWDVDRDLQAKALFEVACAAIDEFQKTPTALILFPRLVIPDSRVLGGFYGSPWSTKNNRSLNLKFRMMNPHFEQSVCTVKEWSRPGYDGMQESRRIGVLFTYTNPW